jgi:hypothetical protein
LGGHAQGSVVVEWEGIDQQLSYQRNDALGLSGVAFTTRDVTDDVRAPAQATVSVFRYRDSDASVADVGRYEISGRGIAFAAQQLVALAGQQPTEQDLTHVQWTDARLRINDVGVVDVAVGFGDPDILVVKVPTWALQRYGDDYFLPLAIGVAKQRLKVEPAALKRVLISDQGQAGYSGKFAVLDK